MEDPKDMVEDLIALGNLTRWETRFVEELGAKLDAGEEPTGDQLAKLMEIWEERV